MNKINNHVLKGNLHIMTYNINKHLQTVDVSKE